MTMSSEPSSPRPSPQKPVETKTETPVEKALRDLKNAPTEPATEPPKKKAPLSQRIKEEALHYWHGSKLLGKEIGISVRLLRKLLLGSNLSRREYRQLKRTLGDVARVVPFIIIVIVPFLEFALPVILKLFPNMLPSTFESKLQEEEKKKKLLKVRLEVAKFLQDTVAEMAINGASPNSNAKEFVEFFHKYRATGEQSSTNEIIAIARKFEDALTLDNLSRPQLVSMCKYMNINAFGTDQFLRSQIASRLRYLKQDDTMIEAEGVDALNIAELHQACQSRGIRTVGMSPVRLRSELSQWLELHLHHQIPSTLLILSRAFLISDKVPKDMSEALSGSAQALQTTLTSLPDQVVNETALQMAHIEGTATAKQKLSVLQEQEELIADELEQEEAQQALKKAKEQQEKEDPAATGNETAVPASDVSRNNEKDLEPEVSHQQMTQIAEAVKTLTSESPLKEVKEELSSLKVERKELIEDLAELSQVTQKEPVKGTSSLGQQVDKMITLIEKEMERFDSEAGSKLNLVRPDAEGRLTLNDLESILKQIRDHPDDDRIKAIVKKLDKDGDGYVVLQEIIHLASDAKKETRASDVKPSSTN